MTWISCLEGVSVRVLKRLVLLCESGCDSEGAGIHVCYAHPHHVSNCRVYTTCIVHSTIHMGLS